MMGLLKHRVRHRTFLCYDPADRAEARAFADYYDTNRDVLIYHEAGSDTDTALLQSRDADYIQRRIRDQYLRDSTVTLVLIGAGTWASRLVDWEIRASLLSQGTDSPNGLLGMLLLSAGENVRLPLRLQMNLGSGYAQVYPHTYRVGRLADAIFAAYKRRATQAEAVANPPLPTWDEPYP